MRIHLVLALFLTGSLFAQDYTIQKSGTTADFRGVSVLSDGAVWASGTHGTYLRGKLSPKGDATWQVAQVPGAEALDFRDVEAFSGDVAYLLSIGFGEQSRIYKTTNGGKSWDLQFTNHDPKGFFDCMAFWDRDRGIAVGDPVNGKLELITTYDGGKNWKSIASGLPPAIGSEGAFAASGTSITVQGKSNVWIATGGPVARVYRSEDSGKSWTVVGTPIVQGSDSTGIFSIAFRDSRHGVIVGGDYKQVKKDGPNLAFSDDGGVTWKLVHVSPQAFFSAVAFQPGSDRVLAVGPALTVEIEGNQARKISDLNLNALSIAADGEAIAVGPKGLVVRIGRGNGR
jgi:photosystem II stability/assembly factor-like uncharacterized protein